MKQTHLAGASHRRFTPALLGLCLVATPLMAQTTPLLNFTFNEGSGITAANSGSALNSNATLNGSAGWTSSDATVTGTGSALSLNGAQGGYASASSAALTGLTSFTATMWINLDTTVGNTAINDRIFATKSSASTGLDLYVQGINSTTRNYTLSFSVDGGAAATTSSSIAPNTWTFVAITYDGTATTNNVRYYISSVAATSLTTLNAVTSDGGAVAAGGNLFVGQTPQVTTDRVPKGLFDDLRFYNSILTPTQIDAIRQETLTPVPEPSAAAALAAVSALGFAAARRRRRRS